ncbi:hypothetical protein E2542_SST13490 [Spatholobus suberectus]|nr:hypothetical protein E2542_SST13490 [Spatholobus suberectus]
MRHRCASCCVSCWCGFWQLGSRWRKQRMRKGWKGSRFVREWMATGSGGGILFSAVMMATAHDDDDGRVGQTGRQSFVRGTHVNYNAKTLNNLLKIGMKPDAGPCEFNEWVNREKPIDDEVMASLLCIPGRGLGEEPNTEAFEDP